MSDFRMGNCFRAEAEQLKEFGEEATDPAIAEMYRRLAARFEEKARLVAIYVADGQKGPEPVSPRPIRSPERGLRVQLRQLNGLKDIAYRPHLLPPERTL